MSILKPKTRDCSAHYAGGTIFSVFSLFMPSYLIHLNNEGLSKGEDKVLAKGKLWIKSNYSGEKIDMLRYIQLPIAELSSL